MPSINAWLADAGDLAAVPTATEAQRAVLAYRRILDKPTSVSFRTPAGATLSAQTVRVESDSTASPAASAAGQGAVRRVVVFGVKGHPTVAATVMEEGYRFVLGNDLYTIVDVIETLGERQGIAEVTG